MELLAETLALEGLVPLLAITLLAGIVYGFAGFGAALVFMPLATTVVDPAVAIAAFSVSALASLVTIVPQAWPNADIKETFTLIGAAFVTTPFGVWLLKVGDAAAISLAVSIAANAGLENNVKTRQIHPNTKLLGKYRDNEKVSANYRPYFWCSNSCVCGAQLLRLTTAF